MSAFLAVDWGTTNLRAWVVGKNGMPLRRVDLPLGVSKLPPGQAARRFQDTVRPALGAQDLPAILCGMIGSNMGWQLAPYLDTPADLDALRRALVRVDEKGPPVWIVPGLRTERLDGGLDVMRGEETQILGWLAANPNHKRGEQLVCQPGTHAKWVRIVDRKIDRFVTSMTGELFDILRHHSVLQVQDGDEDLDAFDHGLRAAGDGKALASRLFTVRSSVVTGQMNPRQAKSYLSGLLIGAEVASVPKLMGIEEKASVAVMGELVLSARYARALAAYGIKAEVFNGEVAVLAGMKALMNKARAA